MEFWKHSIYWDKSDMLWNLLSSTACCKACAPAVVPIFLCHSICKAIGETERWVCFSCPHALQTTYDFDVNVLIFFSLLICRCKQFILEDTDLGKLELSVGFSLYWNTFRSVSSLTSPSVKRSCSWCKESCGSCCGSGSSEFVLLLFRFLGLLAWMLLDFLRLRRVRSEDFCILTC